MSMIAVNRGDDRDVNLALQAEGGGPFDLTGGTVTLLVGTVVGQTADKITKTMTITDPANGLVTTPLVPNDTISLNGDFPYRVKVVTAAGKVKTPEGAYGTFRVVDQVL